MRQFDLELNKTYSLEVKNIEFAGIPMSQLNGYFSDARNSEIFELLLINHISNLYRATKCAPFDFLHLSDKLSIFDLKTGSERGVKLYPSGLIGKGRSYSQKAHIEWLTSLDAIIVLDVGFFPKIRWRSMSRQDILTNDSIIKELSMNELRDWMNAQDGVDIRSLRCRTHELDGPLKRDWTNWKMTDFSIVESEEFQCQCLFNPISGRFYARTSKDVITGVLKEDFLVTDGCSFPIVELLKNSRKVQRIFIRQESLQLTAA